MKITELERRLRALEAKLRRTPVILHFEDGSTQEISGPRRFLFHLFSAVCGGDLKPQQAEQLELIRRCDRAQEPGGSRMVELIRSILDQVDDEIEQGVSEPAVGIPPR